MKGPPGSLSPTQVPDDSSWRPVKIGWLKFSGSPKPLPSTLDAVTLHFRRCVRQFVSKLGKNPTQFKGRNIYFTFDIWSTFPTRRGQKSELVFFAPGGTQHGAQVGRRRRWVNESTNDIFFLLLPSGHCDSDRGRRLTQCFHFNMCFARVLFSPPGSVKFCFNGEVCRLQSPAAWDVRVSSGRVYTVHLPVCCWSGEVVEGTSFWFLCGNEIFLKVKLAEQ